MLQENGPSESEDDSPSTVKAKLAPLIEATKADELMVTTMIYRHEARKHSYEILAKAFS